MARTLGWLRALSRFFPAGFYYKTFKWPQSAWDKVYEPIIRKAAGLGVAPEEADPDSYANRFAHCDLLVVGSGAAGLAAALAGAKAGKNIILCDESARMGGALLSESETTIGGLSAADWVSHTLSELASLPDVTFIPRATAFGYYAQNMVTLCERISDHLAAPESGMPRERLWQIRAREVILATGAIERQIVFPDNDRPAIMLASAGRDFLNQYGVTPGHKIGIYTACDSAWATAFDLKNAGVEIAAIVDMRNDVAPVLVSRALDLDIKILQGHHVVATSGRLRVKTISVQPLSGGETTIFEIDCLLMSGGWTPSVHLFSQSRGKLKYEEAKGRFVPDIYPQDCVCVGSCNGTDDLAKAIGEASFAAGKRIRPKIENAPSMEGHFIGQTDVRTSSDKSGQADDQSASFIDFQNDVKARDIRLAVREGMHSIEHVKRYTTTGMASDQGKMSNMHALAIAAEALGEELPNVGLTTFRSPYTPVTFGTIANHARGDLFDPTRLTPIHYWAKENGAVYEDVGNWKRARYFPKPGEDMDAAVNRECVATRQAAGIFDASTLGKIEVVGPDAVKFMNLMYTNPWDKLAVGRCRYGIMCREDGYIYDDGVIARMSEDRFHVTTTTGGAPRVLNMMEDYLQTEFPEWKVWLTSTSEQWAVIAINGPKARKIIQPFIEGIDLSPDAMPHMSIREGHICGVPCRLMRVSFTGEVGFEINVPADYGLKIWQTLYDHGAPLGMVPYGTEAMHVMRAEKGYIIVGQDTDGTVTPEDAGLGWAIGRKKTDFVGIRGLMRPDLVADGRRQLVGLATKNPETVLEEGAQIVDDPNQAIPMKMTGFVTSSYWSEVLGRSIALAVIDNGHARMGETLYVPMEDETFEVEITGTVFYDQSGDRING